MSPGRVVLWVASLGAIGLSARSILLGPVPAWVAVVAMAVYLTIVMVGVLVPQAEMFGDVWSRGDPSVPAVALTFDDGPDPRTTPRVIEELAAAGVTATFFVVGEKVDAHPELARAIVDAGHSVGAHGYRHDRLYALLPPALVAEDIRRTADAVERAAGVRPRWFRPPVGQVSPRTAEGARRAGVEIVAWSARGLDGLASADPERVAARIAGALRPGVIVLLHDAAERGLREPAGVKALPLVLREIRARGLRVAPLAELIGEA